MAAPPAQPPISPIAARMNASMREVRGPPCIGVASGGGGPRAVGQAAAGALRRICARRGPWCQARPAIQNPPVPRTPLRGAGAVLRSVRRLVLVPLADRPERRPERALGVLLVEGLVDVRHVQGLDRGRPA